MSYIYLINGSDDPQATIALYKKLDDLNSINVHAWMTAYLPIGSRARINIGSSYGIFISYQNTNGQILYESEVLPITDDDRYFRVSRKGHEINLEREETPAGATEVFVSVDKKVGKLIYVNIVRDNQVYYSLPTTPGCSQELMIDDSLFLTKVRPEVTQGAVLRAREILIPPGQIYPGQTAILNGNINLGYDFEIRDGKFSDFVSLVQ
jgi:hypothetical protein